MKSERNLGRLIWDGIMRKRSVTPDVERQIEGKEVAETDGCYVIRTAEELEWVAKMVNEVGCDFAGKRLELAEDIDLSGYKWVPLGQSLQRPFRGVFDGCGRSVTGICVETAGRYSGFFGVVMGIDKIMMAEVRCLNLPDLRIAGRHSRCCAGGLIGYAVEGVIVEKCNVNGWVEGEYCSGGLIGYAEDSIVVRHSSVQGRVLGGELTGTLVGNLATNSVVVNCHSVVRDRYGRPETCFTGGCDETSLVKECCFYS